MIVLIIENSIPMRRVIRSFIGDFGADICECSNAEEAMRLFKQDVPLDWVLLNLEIRNTAGIADIAHIKRYWSAAKVVVLTVYDEIELREAAETAGAYGYVLKEDLSQLRRLVRKNI